MEIVGVIVSVLLSLLLCVGGGCESAIKPSAASEGALTENENEVKKDLPYIHYAPAKIDIMPLTEFVRIGNSRAILDIYVSLLDRFDCQIKSPAVFRFELYQKILRSAEIKGKRLVIWSDINLTAAEENNKYWRDFLRAYELNLDFDPPDDKDYVLQVTCLCPDGKRLSADFEIKQTK